MGSLPFEARIASPHCMPTRTGASTAHRSPHVRAPPEQHPAAPNPPRTAPTRGYAPSTGASAAWRSSACSPVTRYTTRFATDTAWSANRS